ncbi:hypothetical protein MTR62_14695 [Novosphingobium sp. 1949]|uniref:DUF4352 domain-containing protein n=1 Tax=Novosphingobium organovorum TaxID=2930092 RepID=A0ABT0BGF4_9SPHN|nr:hypothetical protein [Novosphingobium organovorum]MCJ2183933.1 hypothetical protein [Novosphingobium organovorum]
MNASAMHGQRSLWPVGGVLFGGWLVVTPLLTVLVGLPLWVMPVLAVVLLLWSCVQPDTEIVGYPLSRLRKLLIGLVVVALWQASAISGTLQSKELEAEAERIVSLGQTDPKGQSAALAKADEEMLAAIGKVAPSLKESEVARRNEEKAAANAPRIAELLGQEKKLDKADVEGRAVIWRELASLAPGDADYRATLTELEEKLARIERVRQDPTKGVEIVDFQWQTDGFGTVMMLDITLRNTSSVELRDFVINCEHSGPSGTVMDRNSRTLYEKLAPGEKRRFRKVNMGFIHSQATSSSCRVDGASMG